MHYQQPQVYGVPQPLVRQEEVSYDYSGRYTQQQAPAAVPIHQQQSYQSMSMPPVSRFIESIGLPLPPVRSFDQPMISAPEQQYQRPQEYRPHAHYEQHHTQPKPKEEKPVGGVSAKLDYDMEWMADFVSDMAQQLVQRGKPSHHSFRTWVHSVLCATRLPSATIVLSLHYLSMRMTMLQEARQPPQEGQIYRLLTVALILGSKFLDDNTFINRSWADVSCIDIKVLNSMEQNWLEDIDYRLHRDPVEAQGFHTWLAHWKEYEAQKLAMGARSLKLSPIDTNVQRHNPVHKTFTPQLTHSAFPPPSAQEYYSARSQQPQYHTPAWTPYDPWLVPRSAMDTSPASAPHTGPTTPEYYGGPGTWAPLDNGAYYNRRYGFTPLSQPQVQPHAQPLPQSQVYPTLGHQYQQHTGWNAHSIHCNCGHCNASRHGTWFMSSGFGHQVAAA
jgi:hypothetical protein